MPLDRKLKIAFNDNRLLILGTQVLFGFQFDGVFQDMFRSLPSLSRALVCSGLSLLTLTIALLIAPSMYHRIVEGGEDSPAVMTLTTVCAAWALPPFAVTLAFDMFIAFGQVAAPPAAIIVGAAFFLTAMFCWFALEFALRKKKPPMKNKRPPMEKAEKPTPLQAKVDQLLTEARLIIPGVQALFGFQLTITLTKAFEELPDGAKAIHLVALCCVAAAITMVMAPASLHRISFDGEDDPTFVKLGSIFVVGAPAALAFGIALDTYVASERALDSSAVASALGVFAIVALLSIWYVWPVCWRLMRGPSRT